MNTKVFDGVVLLPSFSEGRGVVVWSIADEAGTASRLWVDVDYNNGFRTELCLNPELARRIARLLTEAADAIDAHNAAQAVSA